MKIKVLPVLTMVSCVVLTSCGAGELNKKASITANDFFKAVQKKDYEGALGFCSKKAFLVDTKESWTSGMVKNNVLLGDIESFTQAAGLNIATSLATGTTVTVAFDVKRKYGTSKDSVILIKESDGSMKVYGYRWQHQAGAYLSELETSSAEASQYMAAIQKGDYDAALGFCSEDALKDTPGTAWKSFFDNAASKLGAISGYSVVRDSCKYSIEAKGESGKGNYYDIYIKSKRGGNDVMEKIVFFQKTYDDPVRLVGHSFL